MIEVAHNGIGRLGDFTAPDCTPGTAGCVPHWYCYIPLMATPDCLASFAAGTKALTQDVTSAAVGTVTAAASGAAAGAVAGTGQGTCLGLLGGSSFAQTVCQNPTVAALGGAAILFGLIALFKKRGR